MLSVNLDHSTLAKVIFTDISHWPIRAHDRERLSIPTDKQSIACSHIIRLVLSDLHKFQPHSSVPLAILGVSSGYPYTARTIWDLLHFPEQLQNYGSWTQTQSRKKRRATTRREERARQFAYKMAMEERRSLHDTHDSSDHRTLWPPPPAKVVAAKNTCRKTFDTRLSPSFGMEYLWYAGTEGLKQRRLVYGI